MSTKIDKPTTSVHNWPSSATVSSMVRDASSTPSEVTEEFSSSSKAGSTTGESLSVSMASGTFHITTDNPTTIPNSVTDSTKSTLTTAVPSDLPSTTNDQLMERTSTAIGISTANNNIRTSDTFTEVSKMKFNTIESSTSIPSHEDQSSFHSSNVLTSSRTAPLGTAVTIDEHSDEVTSSSSAVMETIDRTISTSMVTPLISISANLIQSETTTKTKTTSSWTVQQMRHFSHYHMGRIAPASPHQAFLLS